MNKKKYINFDLANQRFIEQGRTDIKLCADEYNGWKKKSKFYDEIEKDYFWSIPKDVYFLLTVHPNRRTKKKKNTNLKKYGYEFATQSKLIKEKTKKTNLERYGKDYYLQTKEKKIKSKNTNLKKYGTEFPQQSELVKNKIKNTNLSKYNVTCVFNNIEIKQKIKTTILNKYNVDNISKSNLIKEKKELTSMKNFGVLQPLSSLEIRKKINETNIKKYGVKHPMYSEEVKEKVKNTCKKRYGNNFLFSDLFFNNKNKKKILETKESIKIWLKNLEEPKPSIVTINMHFKGINNVSIKNLEEYIEKYRTYKTGLEILSENLFSSKHYNKKPVNTNLSYKPDFKLSDSVYVNVDGLYWHSEKYKNKHYHFNLRKDFEENNLRIFQFREDEMHNKSNIVKSIVDNSLNKTQNKIYARNTTINFVDSKKAKIFLTNNHLMGTTKAKHIGLYTKDNILISILSYKCKNNICKIERFCSMVNTNVIGGFSKLLNYLETNCLNKNVTEIHNWVDLRYGTGEHLLNKNFFFIKETLGWKWTDYKNTFNRLKCRANMDNRKLSMKEYSEKLGWYKIYDAGQRLYIKHRILNE